MAREHRVHRRSAGSAPGGSGPPTPADRTRRSGRRATGTSRADPATRCRWRDRGARLRAP
ncbi:hypothetical protein PAI11_33640 [Patulibacter medicamentivorans]|uniref:Uncharacterized protein n=1 Tax=Patulibacter medicamentivorans TaxID=1097667 RepID=H0E949_9ACTN|nr:hypothetical protein PAI11_33640 [Patulibacter medicamentivorans]